VDQLRGIYNEMKIKQAQSEANKKKTVEKEKIKLSYFWG
jgi:hypothetical protein